MKSCSKTLPCHRVPFAYFSIKIHYSIFTIFFFQRWSDLFNLLLLQNLLQNKPIIFTEIRLVLDDGYEKHTVLFCCTQCFDLFQRQDRECFELCRRIMSIAHPVLERHTICLTTLGRTCPVLHLILYIILNLLSQLLGGLDWPLMSSCLQYYGAEHHPDVTLQIHAVL